MSFFNEVIGRLGQRIIPRQAPQPAPTLTTDGSLSPDQQRALEDLARALTRNDYWSQRQEAIRKFKAREYFKGFHYIPFGDEYRGFAEVSSSPAIGPQFVSNGVGDETSFTFNFFQAYGKAIMSVLGGRVPGVKYYARDTNNAQDVLTQGAAQDTWEHFKRVNRIQGQQAQMLLYAWTDGSCGIYVAPVTDASRFGTHQEPVITPVPVTVPGVPPHNGCPDCSAQAPPEAPQCPQCGVWFGPHTLSPGVPDSVELVPQQTGVQDVPNTEIVMNVIGGLELQVIPPDARDMTEYLALSWKTELDIAYVKAMHPDKADQIRAGTALNDLDQQGRFDRLRSKSRTAGGQTSGPFVSSYLDDDVRVTYTRIWIRPMAFYRIKDARTREALLAAYPKGVKVTMAGAVLCEAVPESLEDHWYVWFPNAGDGQIRESMGDVLLDVQDALNDLYNLALDQLRHSIPITFVDEKLVNMEAIDQQRERGGMMWPVNRIDQQPLSGNFHTTTPAAFNPQITEMIAQLAGFVAQFLTGANPALLGQGSSDLKTAAGYKMALGQSLGRMSMPWRALCEGFVEIAKRANRQFVAAHQENGTVISKFANNSLVARQISAEELQGQVVCYPENDEEYPQNPADVRDVLLGWVNSPNPQLQQASMDPDNFGFVRTYLGVNGFSLPGERQRAKQLREIQELLKGQPIPPPIDPMTGMVAVDPMTGAPLQPQSSIPIDPIFDDNPMEFLTVQHWFWTEEAKTAMVENPAGFENVRLHGMAHFQQAQMAMMPPPGPGGPGGPPPGAPSLDIPPQPGLGEPPPELTQQHGPQGGPPPGLG